MSLELEEAIEEFLLSVRQRKSQATHYQYRWHLVRWRTWCIGRGVHHVADFTGRPGRKLLLEWGDSLVDQWSKATRRLAISAVRSFLRWCNDEKIIADDAYTALKMPRPEKRSQRRLKPDEVLKLLKQCQIRLRGGLDEDDSMRVGLRNAAIICLLYDSLLRASELCRLRIRDLDLEARTLRVQIKGGREGVGQFSETTAERLRAWLNVRQPADGVDTVFVAIGGRTPGRSLNRTGLRLILLRIGERAGVPNVTTHAFRRGGARALVRAGASDQVAAEFGRWEHTDMVRLYAQDDLGAAELYDRYSPVGHMNLSGLDFAQPAVAPNGSDHKNGD